MDIPMSEGTEVKAPCDGKVVYCGNSGGYGNTVVIKMDNGKECRFAHLDKILCKEGDAVKSGETLCLSGNTGRSTGPHLHVEIKDGDNNLNPLSFFSEAKNM